MTERILTVNAGSNSLKCGLFSRDLTSRYSFEADRIHKDTRMTIRSGDGDVLVNANKIDSGYESALAYVIEWCENRADPFELVAAGHRVVHGGPRCADPVLVDEAVKAELRTLIPLAPSHQPYNLELMDILARRLPHLPQVACFDTAFHRTQPWIARQFALPRGLVERESLYRYGFHGLSYEYVNGVLSDYLNPQERSRVICMHLASGASACAIKDGKSVATTMGLTALDGLMMGKRPGQLDPGLLLYLLKERGWSVDDLEETLYRESGLKGVSGISGDMRDLEQSDKPEAHQAIDLFCYTAARYAGSLAVAMGGVDALVFTGAMGAKDPAIREIICGYLGWLGVELDPDANGRGEPVTNADSSKIRVLTIPTDEEVVLARHVVQRLFSTV